MSRILIHFTRFGPYHLARLNAAYEVCASKGVHLIGLETAGEDETYEWSREDGRQGWQRVTVFPEAAVENLSTSIISVGVRQSLDHIQPDVLVIAGWGGTDARACLKWAKRNGRKAIVMSETREADGTRVWWKEWLKRRIVRQFDAALVGGESHARYVAKLGIPEAHIHRGYNVVNNTYFADESRRWREGNAGGSQAQRKYFLASNRFIERKNIHRLIQAYASYLKQLPASEAWDLCLIGDGDLKASLIQKCHDHALKVIEKAPWEVGQADDPVVYFPGFRQIDELPRFYANAGCFVHPAIEEPWGLVINEAMAARLPILSGNNVGAAEELVDEGVNGYCVDAKRVEDMTDTMQKMTGMTEQELNKMGEMSAQLVEERAATQAFGDGVLKAIEALYEA